MCHGTSALSTDMYMYRTVQMCGTGDTSLKSGFQRLESFVTLRLDLPRSVQKTWMKDLRPEEQVLILEDRVDHMHSAVAAYNCSIAKAWEMNSRPAYADVKLCMAGELLCKPLSR